MIPQCCPDSAHQFVSSLDPLVGVGVRAQRDMLTLPDRSAKLCVEYVGDVDFDDDLAVEVLSRVEAKEFVCRAREAVATAMTAASVRVDRPAERHACASR